MFIKSNRVAVTGKLLAHIQSRSVTNQHDDSYGVLLHSMDHISDYYDVM